MKKKKLFTKAQRKRLLSIVAGGVLAAGGAVFSLFDLPYISAAMFICAGAAAGAMCVSRAVRGIFSGSFFDENTLMTIAAIGAILLGEYAECCAVMILYQIGELFQSVAVGRSRKAISALSALCPDYANMVTDEGEKTVHPTALSVGDIIRIKPGERIPVDCLLLEGESAVDTSPVTGESLPRDAVEGDALYSGCINMSSVVTAKVTATTTDSAAGRILALTETASERKTKAETFITRFAKVYTPAVAAIAAFLAFGVPLLIHILTDISFAEAFPEWSERALTMLVISCPCALVISVPLGYFCGLGNASKNAILIKGSTYVDALAGADTAVFDKTGTLTQGKLSVVRVVPAEGETRDIDEILSLARAAEESSTHPIARAIVLSAEKRYSAKSISEAGGSGVSAVLDDGRVIEVKKPESTDSTACAVYEDKELVGTVYFEDKLKEEAPAAIKGLNKMGFKECIMLTGDNEITANEVGRSAGIDTVYASLMPDEKFQKIEKLCEKGKVMYAGDGINDAPSLARADVGIAMGALGSPGAIEAADVVLMSTDLSRLVYAVKLSKRTVRTVKANIAISLGVKIAVLILAAIGLGGMWAAIAADVGVCILCVTNSTRLLR